MFENLLHQERITLQLRRDIAAGSLPPALLFTGAAFSGKLTAALETARALCCRDSGPGTANVTPAAPTVPSPIPAPF